MKSIVDFVLNNKLAVWILTLLVLFVGVFSSSKMKMESMPDVSIPIMMVMTTYPGASADQVSTEIGDVLENKIKNLEDIKNISSTSSANFNMLMVEFEYGVDMEKQENEVKKIVEATEFDERIQEPQVMAITLDAMPVVVANVFDEERTGAELTKLLNEQVVGEIAKIDGVGEALVNGAIEQKYVLKFDEAKLAELQMDKETIISLIQANNTKVPLGVFEFEETEETVVIGNMYANLDDLMAMTLPIPSPKPVTLNDVAKVEEKGVVETVSRINGKDSLTFAVTKAQGGNTVEVVEDVVKELDELTENYKTIEYELVLDQAEPIKDSVFTMLEKAIFGAIFAVIIILIFLKNIRSTLISIISIPMSLLMAIIILEYMGITLNIMTLGALTVAIGRVIDDSVVVVENIFRRLTLEGETLTGKALVKSATIEMFIPILSSTLVTIAVFLPLMLVGGMVGELFMPFAFTMAFALIASLLVAITIVPMFAHSLFKKELLKEKVLKQHGETSKFTKGYAKLLEKSMNNKGKFLTATVIVLGLSIALIGKVGFTFMGEETSYEVNVQYEAPVGEAIEVVEKNLISLENKFIGMDGIDSVQVSTGGGGMAAIMGGPDASITLTLNEELSGDKLEEIKEKVELITFEEKVNGKWTVNEAAASMLGENTADITITGVNEEDMREASNLIVEEMSKIEGLSDVESSLSRYYVENNWVVDVEKASQYGLTAAQVAMQVMNYETENEVTKVMMDGKEVTIVDLKEKLEYKAPEELAEKMIMSPMGVAVKLKDVATLEQGESVETIVKDAGKLNVTVSGTIEGKELLAISEKITELSEKLELPEGVQVETGGTTEDMNEAFAQLGLAIVAAIAIVYFILVVTFKEGLAPFAILFSLPLLIIGVVFGNLIAGEPLSISSMLGILMLIGIVVTNAIVLVDKIIHNEKEGMDLRTSIVHAAEVRLRPIIMTALATILALAPLLVQEASMSMISKGLAVTVIGGLLTSTILTLFIVPIVYEILTKIFKKDRSKKEE